MKRSSTRRSRPVPAFAVTAAALLAASCGGGGRYDDSGLASGSGDREVFLRASQEYFRGSLSAAEEGFGEIAAGSPDSPLLEDATLALRRIERERSGLPFADSLAGTGEAPPVGSPLVSSVALVGRPLVANQMERLSGLFAAVGCAPVSIEDQGAPQSTIVLFPDGMEAEAAILADTLAAWLASPAEIVVQPGGSVIPTIAPGHEGIVVVVGTDAVVERTGSPLGGSAPIR